MAEPQKLALLLLWLCWPSTSKQASAAAVATASTAGTSEGFYGGGSGVVELDPDSFRHAVAESSDWWVVEWYHPRCSHCASLRHMYTSAATNAAAAGIPVRFGAINCEAHPFLASFHGVVLFPTFEFYGAPNAHPLEYSGWRTSAALVRAAAAFAARNGSSIPWGVSNLFIHTSRRIARLRFFSSKNFFLLASSLSLCLSLALLLWQNRRVLFFVLRPIFLRPTVCAVSAGSSKASSPLGTGGTASRGFTFPKSKSCDAGASGGAVSAARSSVLNMSGIMLRSPGRGLSTLAIPTPSPSAGGPPSRRGGPRLLEINEASPVTLDVDDFAVSDETGLDGHGGAPLSSPIQLFGNPMAMRGRKGSVGKSNKFHDAEAV